VIPLGWAILAGAVLATGLSLVASMWRRPTLATVVASLDPTRAGATSGPIGVGGAWSTRFGGVDDAALAVIDRNRRQHSVLLMSAFAGGGAVPLIALGVGHAARLVAVPMFLPPAVALVGALTAVAAVQRSTLDAVAAIRADLRHQLSAYLDVVTMLVAGDTGHETALEQAAAVGEGRLFEELRPSLRDVGARGHSLVGALDDVARRCGLVELEQIAGALDLAASDGAPIVRSLTARTATLRTTAASEQEMEARLRTSRLTGPTVGMALVFMALVVYPALAVT
jgi:hypothetical protein